MRVSWSVIAFGRPKVVDRFGLNGIQVNESQKEDPVRIKQAREMGRVEPDGVLFDFPYDSADTLVALADGA